MAKQKKFLSRAEILKAIDAANKRKIECLKQAELVEDEIKKWQKSTSYEAAEQIGFLREECNRFRVSAHNAEHKKLPRLKAALAEFDTYLLGLDKDKSVVLKP